MTNHEPFESIAINLQHLREKIQVCEATGRARTESGLSLSKSFLGCLITPWNDTTDYEKESLGVIHKCHQLRKTLKQLHRNNPNQGIGNIRSALVQLEHSCQTCLQYNNKRLQHNKPFQCYFMSQCQSRSIRVQLFVIE